MLEEALGSVFFWSVARLILGLFPGWAWREGLGNCPLGTCWTICGLCLVRLCGRCLRAPIFPISLAAALDIGCFLEDALLQPD